VLGGEPVLEREDRGVGGDREAPAEPVGRGDAADRPAARVQVEDERKLSRPGAVEARGQSLDLKVADRIHRRSRLLLRRTFVQRRPRLRDVGIVPERRRPQRQDFHLSVGVPHCVRHLYPV